MKFLVTTILLLRLFSSCQGGWRINAVPWKTMIKHCFVATGILFGVDTVIPSCSSAGNSETLLKSKVLEQYRLFDQLEDDAIDYVKTNKQLLLLPIVQLYQDVSSVSSAIESRDMSKIQELSKLFLTGDGYTTPILKKVFNRYSDNIFYTDPDRLNIYLGGGAVPDTAQTTQYLLRNEILSKLDDLRIDLQLLTDSPQAPTELKKSISPSQLFEDSYDDCRQLLRTFSDYLKYASPEDISVVKSSLIKSKL